MRLVSRIAAAFLLVFVAILIFNIVVGTVGLIMHLLIVGIFLARLVWLWGSYARS